MRAIGIIPARYQSTRLPGKPLAEIHGKPMIQWVYERAVKAETLEQVIVATDDPRIFDAVAGFGGRAVMTSPDHRSGTDRLAEAARGLEVEVVVNIQGDEPLIDPRAIDLAARPLLEDPAVPMATLMTGLSDLEELESPGVVKVVTDRAGFALYFSRHPIPCLRGASLEETLAAGLHRKHIGLYAYRKDFLLRYASLEPTPLEKAESLEQLRVLEHGYRIRVVECPYPSVSVDTPEDLARVRRLIG